MADNKTEKQKVQEITDQLEKGLAEIFDSDKYKSYLSTMSKFHNYSVNNTLLIAMQRPDAQLIAGYQAWQKNFNRHVLRGEKAIKILAPAPYIIKEERSKIDPVTREPMLDQDGVPIKENVDVKIPAFRAVSVFDVGQTDGEPIPELEVKELMASVDGYEDFEKALRQISPVPIGFEDIAGDAKGYFHNEDKRIAIQQGMSESQTLKTMLHEVAHAMLHDKDLNQTMDEPVKDRNTKEVEAESIAYTVSARYGIDTSDYSFNYLAGWSSGKDMKELKSSLDTIRTTASQMITDIDTQLKVLQKDRQMEQNPDRSKEHIMADDVIVRIQSAFGVEFEVDRITNMKPEEVEVHLMDVVGLMDKGMELPDGVAGYLMEHGAEVIPIQSSSGLNDGTMSFFDFEIDEDTNDITRMTDMPAISQAQNLIHRLEFNYGQFTDEEKDFIVNYAYKTDDMEKTTEMAERILAFDSNTDPEIRQLISNARGEIEALPDPSIGISEMHEYGYTWAEMLPLNKEEAQNLFDMDVPVYLLHSNGMETLVEDRKDIETHDGIMGIEKSDWNNFREKQTEISLVLDDEETHVYRYPFPVVAVDINEMGGDRTAIFKTSEEIPDSLVAALHSAYHGTDLEMEIAGELRIEWLESIEEDGNIIKPEIAREQKAEKEGNLEAQLLYGKENQYGIYQLKRNEPSLDEYRFTGTESLKQMGITKDNFEEIKRDNYDLIYVGDLTDKMGLEAIYEKFNLHHPEDFKGHSLSVSDIVVLHKEGENTAHFVDSFGFTTLPDFLEKQEEKEVEKAEAIAHPEIEEQDEIIDLRDEPFEPRETELAFQLADRYITIQEVEDGYDYTIFDANYKELDGGVYDNPDISIREALSEIVDDLKQPHYNEETRQYVDSALRGNIKAEDELIPMDYDTVTEKAEEVNRIVPQKESSIIENFKEKTNECFHNIDDLSVEEVTLNAWAYVQSKIDEAGLDAHIVDLAIVGSRCRGLEGKESDLDIVMEFTGDVREDDFFNLLHEDGIQFGGVKVDINPITEAKTGTLETYLPMVEAYLEQKKQDQVRLQQENAVSVKPVEVSLFVAECSEFHDMGEFYDGIKSVNQAIDVYQQIPQERIHGIRGIGVQLHREGEKPYQDTEWDILSGNVFSIDMLDYISEIKDNPEAMDKIAELIAKMPEKEVHGKLTPDMEQKMLEYREQHIEDMAQSLAIDLDQFAYDYDTYGYNDEVEDREATLKDIGRVLSAGETSEFKEWLQSVIEDGEPAEDMPQAQELLKRIETLETWREYKPLAKVEELEEANYNMIDNVLNNGAGSEKDKKEENKKQQEEQTKPSTRKRKSLKERLAEKKKLVSGKANEAPEKVNDKNTERGL